MITSTANKRIRELQRLAKRRERDASRRFVVEGARELGRALDAGVTFDVLVCRPPLRREEEALLGRATAAGADAFEVSENVLQSLAYRDGDGIVGVARMFDVDVERLALPPAPLVLVAAEIEKPGNLGAMLRTAAAAGVDAVLVADTVTDLFNPNVIRASLGAVFAVPVGVGRADQIVPWLRRHGVPVLATSPDAAVPYWEAPLAEGAAVVIGSERAGLPEPWLAAADHRIVVPMPGDSGVDSLNAASTAAIVLFDAVRQRVCSAGGGSR